VNRKLNTLLFILGATVLNLLIMALLLLLGLFVISMIFRNSEPGAGVQIALFVVFALGIGGTFVVYNRVIRWVAGKVDMDKYFHPLFRPGGKKKP